MDRGAEGRGFMNSIREFFGSSSSGFAVEFWCARCAGDGCDSVEWQSVIKSFGKSEYDACAEIYADDVSVRMEQLLAS